MVVKFIWYIWYIDNIDYLVASCPFTTKINFFILLFLLEKHSFSCQIIIHINSLTFLYFVTDWSLPPGWILLRKARQCHTPQQCRLISKHNRARCSSTSNTSVTSHRVCQSLRSWTSKIALFQVISATVLELGE